MIWMVLVIACALHQSPEIEVEYTEEEVQEYYGVRISVRNQTEQDLECMFASIRQVREGTEYQEQTPGQVVPSQGHAHFDLPWEKWRVYEPYTRGTDIAVLYCRSAEGGQWRSDVYGYGQFERGSLVRCEVRPDGEYWCDPWGLIIVPLE